METTTQIEVSTADQEKARARRRLRARLAILFLCLALSGLAVVPFYFLGWPAPRGDQWALRMPTTHDMFLHFDQMRDFYRGLSAGEIYPRWEEDTNRGYGAPTMSYYPPGIYYLTSSLYPILRDWTRVLMGAHLIMMIASAAAIYFYAKQILSRQASAVAMAAYIILPYHLLDQYQRGAMAEMLGFIWMPLILLFAERLLKERRVESYYREPEAADTGAASSNLIKPSRKASSLLLNAAGLAASYGAFIWSHPPTAYQFTLIFGAFIVPLAVLRRDWKGLLFVGAAMALGLALSAAYLYPAAIEQDFIRHEYVEENWPYHKSYVFARTAYATAHYTFFDLIDFIWSFGAVAIPVCSIAALTQKPRGDATQNRIRERVWLWLAMGAAASFMMTRASFPLGRLIPKIEIGVFTWRMLAITTLVLALLVGACAQAAFDALKRRQTIRWVAYGSLSLMVVAVAVACDIFGVIRPMIRAPVFKPSAEHLNFATVPRTGPKDVEQLPVAEPVEFDRIAGQVTIQKWDPEHREFTAQLSEPDKIYVRTFYFPGWTAAVNGEPASIIKGKGVGDIVLKLPAGTHHIKLDYLDTLARRKGRIISIASLSTLMAAVIAALAIKAAKRRINE